MKKKTSTIEDFEEVIDEEIILPKIVEQAEESLTQEQEITEPINTSKITKKEEVNYIATEGNKSKTEIVEKEIEEIITPLETINKEELITEEKTSGR